MELYESYEIVKYDEDTFDTLYNLVDDPEFDYDDEGDEPFPFQILGEIDYANGDNFYEVITGFHTEDQAKRYVAALERADLLKDHIDKSLESTLETIQKENRT